MSQNQDFFAFEHQDTTISRLIVHVRYYLLTAVQLITLIPGFRPVRAGDQRVLDASHVIDHVTLPAGCYVTGYARLLSICSPADSCCSEDTLPKCRAGDSATLMCCVPLLTLSRRVEQSARVLT